MSEEMIDPQLATCFRVVAEHSKAGAVFAAPDPRCPEDGNAEIFFSEKLGLLSVEVDTSTQTMILHHEKMDGAILPPQKIPPRKGEIGKTISGESFFKLYMAVDDARKDLDDIEDPRSRLLLDEMRGKCVAAIIRVKGLRAMREVLQEMNFEIPLDMEQTIDELGEQLARVTHDIAMMSHHVVETQDEYDDLLEPPYAFISGNQTLHVAEYGGVYVDLDDAGQACFTYLSENCDEEWDLFRYDTKFGEVLASSDRKHVFKYNGKDQTLINHLDTLYTKRAKQNTSVVSKEHIRGKARQTVEMPIPELEGGNTVDEIGQEVVQSEENPPQEQVTVGGSMKWLYGVVAVLAVFVLLAIYGVSKGWFDSKEPSGSDLAGSNPPVANAPAANAAAQSEEAAEEAETPLPANTGVLVEVPAEQPETGELAELPAETPETAEVVEVAEETPVLLVPAMPFKQRVLRRATELGYIQPDEQGGLSGDDLSNWEAYCNSLPSSSWIPQEELEQAMLEYLEWIEPGDFAQLDLGDQDQILTIAKSYLPAEAQPPAVAEAPEQSGSATETLELRPGASESEKEMLAAIRALGEQVAQLRGEVAGVSERAHKNAVRIDEQQAAFEGFVDNTNQRLDNVSKTQEKTNDLLGMIWEAMQAPADSGKAAGGVQIIDVSQPQVEKHEEQIQELLTRVSGLERKVDEMPEQFRGALIELREGLQSDLQRLKSRPASGSHTFYNPPVTYGGQLPPGDSNVELPNGVYIPGVSNPEEFRRQQERQRE